MEELIARFTKFVGVGGVATLLQYVLIILFVEVFSVVPLHASIASYFFSAIFNYWANYHFTFASGLPHRRTIPKFALVACCGLIINALIFHAAHTLLGYVYLVAQIIATIFVLLWNFTANSLWSFSDNSSSKRLGE